jgi:hypothetical protein
VKKSASAGGAAAGSPVKDVVALLEQIVAATPAPTGGCDPSELVDLAEKIAQEREPLCAALGRAVEAAGGANEAVAAASAPLLAALTDVDARWQAALAAARVALAQRTTTASRRHYR